MKWIDTLERKFGHLAIHGLIRIVVFFNAAVFILSLVNPHFVEMLYLDPERVKHGEVWRLFTYIFIPSLGEWWLMPNYLWLGFWLYWVWIRGEGLEQAWGAFKFNLYYFLGMAGTTVAAFVFGASFNNYILNLSLLFAFATIYPDYVIYLFLMIPMKIKWSAWIAFAFLLLTFVVSSTPTRMAIIASLVNYIIFFGSDVIKIMKHRNQVAGRRARFRRDQMKEDEAIHRCAVCNRTEISSPDLDFRVSADGNEYCVDHLPVKKS